MWAGWHRKDSRSAWQRVCNAETLDACHKALLAAVKGKRVRNTDLFLTGGQTPPDCKEGRSDFVVRGVK
jgi:hypothetical protein